MENASKALIIAGAILLAILLISLGIMVFNQASNTVSNSGMTDAERTAFNQKFLKYEGEQTGNMVKALIQEVIVNNSQSENADRIVKINDKTGGDLKTSTIPGKNIKIETNKKYKVTMVYTNGIIQGITVSE